MAVWILLWRLAGVRLQHFISLSSTDELYEFIIIYAGPHSWSSLHSHLSLSVVCSFSCVSSRLSLVIAGLSEGRRKTFFFSFFWEWSVFLQALHVGQSWSTRGSRCAMTVSGTVSNRNQNEISVFMYNAFFCKCFAEVLSFCNMLNCHKSNFKMQKILMVLKSNLNF